MFHAPFDEVDQRGGEQSRRSHGQPVRGGARKAGCEVADADDVEPDRAG
jgi:hypothetical protein